MIIFWEAALAAPDQDVQGLIVDLLCRHGTDRLSTEYLRQSCKGLVDLIVPLRRPDAEQSARADEIIRHCLTSLPDEPRTFLSHLFGLAGDRTDRYYHRKRNTMHACEIEKSEYYERIYEYTSILAHEIVNYTGSAEPVSSLAARLLSNDQTASAS